MGKFATRTPRRYLLPIMLLRRVAFPDFCSPACPAQPRSRPLGPGGCTRSSMTASECWNSGQIIHITRSANRGACAHLRRELAEFKGRIGLVGRRKQLV